VSEIHLGDIVYTLESNLLSAAKTGSARRILNQFVVVRTPYDYRGDQVVLLVPASGDNTASYRRNVTNVYRSARTALIGAAMNLEKESRVRQDAANQFRDLAKDVPEGEAFNE
jgi:hypothetical protein